ncbi:MAG: BlaI/MecI/CopY family transcriptional regulator [Pseudomonadota bacterium]
MPTISDAEMQVMEVLWTAAPKTAAAIAGELEGRTGWHRKTVNTLLSRLEKKGAVTAEPARGGKRYSPCVARETYTQSVAGAMVEQLFGGRVAPLVAHFADARGLSAEDVADLEQLVKELKTDD